MEEPDTFESATGSPVAEVPSAVLGAQVAEGHEQVVFCHDADSGLRAIIAVHSTRLGPALGGTRFYPFASEAAACAAVVGSANNQLATRDCGRLLHETGVLYVPDYVANAGGVVNIAFELGRRYRWADAQVAVRRIFDSTRTVLETARRESIETSAAADRVAEERMRTGDRTGLPPPPS